jgi:hypothetical protein
LQLRVRLDPPDRLIAIHQRKLDILIVTTGAATQLQRDLIVGLAARHQLPTVFRLTRQAVLTGVSTSSASKIESLLDAIGPRSPAGRWRARRQRTTISG